MLQSHQWSSDFEYQENWHQAWNNNIELQFNPIDVKLFPIIMRSWLYGLSLLFICMVVFWLLGLYQWYTIWQSVSFPTHMICQPPGVHCCVSMLYPQGHWIFSPLTPQYQYLPSLGVMSCQCLGSNTYFRKSSPSLSEPPLCISASSYSIFV